MNEVGENYISTKLADRKERRLLLIFVLVSAGIFAAAAPFAKVALPPFPTFIALYLSAMCIVDLITAVLLLGQFIMLRQRSLLALACGYLFNLIMAISQGLSFPGLFAPQGLIGNGSQTTAWLYFFWHAGFPSFVVIYAALKKQITALDFTTSKISSFQIRTVVTSAAITVGVALSLVFLATHSASALPALMLGNDDASTKVVVATITWLMAAVALFALWVRRPHMTFDLGLMAVNWVWIFDIALASVLNHGRYDLGWYVGRIYGLVASSFVLMVLLAENGILYARLAESHGRELKERQRAQSKSEQLASLNATLRMLYRVAGDLNRGVGEAEVCKLALLGILELPEFRSGWISLDEDGTRARNFGAPESANVQEDSLSYPVTRLPLLANGHKLGSINLIGMESVELSDEILGMLHAIANQLTVALQRCELLLHLETQVAQRTESLQSEIQERIKTEQKVINLNRLYAVLSGINSTIVRSHDRLELFDEACRIAVALGKFELAWIGTVESEGSRVRPVVWKGYHAVPDDWEKAFAAAQIETVDAHIGWIGQALSERGVALCNDLSASSEDTFPPNLVANGCHSLAVLPMRVGGGVAGILVLCSSEPQFFADAMELDLLKEVAGDIAFALEYIQKTEQLDYLAYYDAITGLANRALFQDRITQLLLDNSRADGERSSLGLLLIDIERFKDINDTFGRHVGDVLIKRVAGRLAEALNGTDRLARLGITHFAVIASGLKEESDIAHLLDNTILPQLNLAYSIDGKQLHLTFRTGVSLFPNDAENVETMFAHAETALQIAKLNDERYMFYASPMNARVSQQLLLENRLRRALEQGEFVLYYQPKVSMSDGNVVGLEALIRWQDPEYGLIPPGEFIPVLEETGMIVEVGRWVLQKAMTDIETWIKDGITPPRVAVNVSSMQLRRKDFVETLKDVLTGRRYTGNLLYLDLELTESVLIADVETSIQKLNAIRDMGMKLSIDDFGTGYSSLSYLKRLPIDYLKIDQSFVRDITTDPSAASICISIIDLAHNLKMRVVAEGVETEAQMNYLRRHHCDEMQGYLFSRPISFKECTQLMIEQRKYEFPLQSVDERRTLLIIDDEASILAALKRLLRREDYNILTADNASLAFNLLATHNVQVVVSDQRMPEMNGTEFLSRVKELYPHTVRIVLSGYTDLDSITSAVNQGAIYKFFTKPWNDDTMRENIREAFVAYESRLGRKL
ncbi:EAL domain-containing protein [Rhodoferax sp. GW822-FHT02A01]|uniref:EAL domain-containing protein n=1 Tax=Rhodoferax sp. GW822-FHT02A01 TaxID=3141537 RepID=UPI00315CF98A